MKALNPFAPFWYVVDQDRRENTENPTRFKVKGLNGSQIGYIAPEYILDDTSRTITGLTGKGIDLALKYGLVDWENLQNDKGEVAFNVNNFALLPFEVRAELALQIIAASYVTQEEKKTS